MASDLLDRMLRNRAADWQIKDVEAVCREYGLLFRPEKGLRIAMPSTRPRSKILTIPARRPIKPVYIRKLVRYIEMHGDVL